MDVSIKSFDVEMIVKNNGIELEIREPNDGTRLGDLVVTKKYLVWCPGKTQPKNGIKLKWVDFIQMMNDSQPDAKKLEAKKKATFEHSDDSAR